MYIFLDDERSPTQVTWVKDFPRNAPWVVVRNYDAFCSVVNLNDNITHISFDHDLAEEHYGDGLHGDAIDYSKYKGATGYDCAKFLVAHYMRFNRKLPNYTIHSMNPIGSENIRAYLENYNLFYEKELER